ncbi:hypothetical protein A1O7_01921, partial [Cladophialophora yegresii CBS 114405]
RVHGCGGGMLGYNKLITAYRYNLGILEGESGLPRRKNALDASLNVAWADTDTKIRIRSPEQNSGQNSTDGQSVADGVSGRYGKLLKCLVPDTLRTAEALVSELELMLRVFIDSDNPEAEPEADCAVRQSIPFNGSFQSSIVARSIQEVPEEHARPCFSSL